MEEKEEELEGEIEDLGENSDAELSGIGDLELLYRYKSMKVLLDSLNAMLKPHRFWMMWVINAQTLTIYQDAMPIFNK